MLETIEVTFPYTSEPAFGTPEEAIAFSVSIERARQPSDITSCVGQKIRFAGWRDDAIFLQLENDKVLHFQYTEKAVDLTIDDDVPDDVANEARPQEVVLSFPSGDRIVWHKDMLIKSLEGNVVHRIAAAQAGFFLYVANNDILWIDFVSDRRTGRSFLYWALTD